MVEHGNGDHHDKGAMLLPVFHRQDLLFGAPTVEHDNGEYDQLTFLFVSSFALFTSRCAQSHGTAVNQKMGRCQFVANLLPFFCAVV